MQFNKCSRCGGFFVTNSDVCPNCQPKDLCDMNKLKSFLFNVSDELPSTEAISNETGISTKNLHRFFCSDEFANLNFSDPEMGSKMSL